MRDLPPPAPGSVAKVPDDVRSLNFSAAGFTDIDETLMHESASQAGQRPDTAGEDDDDGRSTFQACA